MASGSLSLAQVLGSPQMPRVQRAGLPCPACGVALRTAGPAPAAGSVSSGPPRAALKLHVEMAIPKKPVARPTSGLGPASS